MNHKNGRKWKKIQDKKQRERAKKKEREKENKKKINTCFMNPNTQQLYVRIPQGN